MINDSTISDAERVPDLEAFPEIERRLLEHASTKEIRAVARLTHQDLERMIVGRLIGVPFSTKKPDTLSVEKIIEAGIKKDWFDDKLLGDIFEQFLIHYRQKRTLITLDEIYN